MSVSDILSRMANPGFLLVLAGAIPAYASGKIAAKVFAAQEERRDRLSARIKLGGCALAAVGALLAVITVR